MVKLKIFSALVFATAFFHTAYAQNGIHLQSIVRDKAFDILPNTDVSFRVSAIEKQEFGSPVYVETQKVTTNDFGLASFYFGKGTSLMGHFDSIK
ncbi:MAG: hypothetical protein O3B78_08805, partial [Bacteroidetes bacterium]|nr:hypothetical protein [Bacteroidota bacterium]